MLNHLVFNENMTSWLLFFFHMANWKMRLFDLYFNYTPSDLSPLHFLSNMNLESKHTLIFPISPASRMATKKLFSLHFSDSPVICGGLEQTLFLPAVEPGKGFRWGVRLLGSATTLGPPQLPGALFFPCPCSSPGKGVILCHISCYRRCCYEIVLLKCWRHHLKKTPQNNKMLHFLP